MSEGRNILALIKELRYWIIGAVIVFIGTIIVFSILGKESEAEIISESSLKKIIEVSELSTYEAVYNGIAQKK